LSAALAGSITSSCSIRTWASEMSGTVIVASATCAKTRWKPIGIVTSGRAFPSTLATRRAASSKPISVGPTIPTVLVVGLVFGQVELPSGLGKDVIVVSGAV